MPALFTRMSIGPSSFQTRSIIGSTSARFETSPGAAIARVPLDVIDRTTSSAWVRLSTALTATWAPSSANTSAMPRPMPRAAPCTNARLPLSFMRFARLKPSRSGRSAEAFVLHLLLGFFQRQGEDVVALRFQLPRHDRDVPGRHRFVRRCAEDHVFAAAGFEHGSQPFGIRLELALPQNAPVVLVERADHAVAVRADEDQAAGGHHRSVAVDAPRVARVLDPFFGERPHGAERRAPGDGALVQVVRNQLRPGWADREQAILRDEHRPQARGVARDARNLWQRGTRRT